MTQDDWDFYVRKARLYGASSKAEAEDSVQRMVLYFLEHGHDLDQPRGYMLRSLRNATNAVKRMEATRVGYHERAGLAPAPPPHPERLCYYNELFRQSVPPTNREALFEAFRDGVGGLTDRRTDGTVRRVRLSGYRRRLLDAAERTFREGGAL